MITHQESSVPIICPHCESTDSCEHLFALYDITFNTIEGGYFYGKNEAEFLIEEFYSDLIQTNGFSATIPALKDYTLREFWDDLLSIKEDLLFNETDNKWNIYIENINSLIFEVLDDVEIPEYGEFEGGSGQSSAFKIYYSKEPYVTYNKFIDELKKLLEENSENKMK